MENIHKLTKLLTRCTIHIYTVHVYRTVCNTCDGNRDFIFQVTGSACCACVCVCFFHIISGSSGCRRQPANFIRAKNKLTFARHWCWFSSSASTFHEYLLHVNSLFVCEHVICDSRAYISTKHTCKSVFSSNVFARAEEKIMTSGVIELFTNKETHTCLSSRSGIFCR